tara:strand:- start:11496 stop:12104 length:609 start_codon:yes stop_codon:yes gene_type:complete
MILAHPPALLKKLYPSLVWEFKDAKNEVYLTFDDGPVPGITDQVLDLLEAYDAKATFFCVADNVKKHPELFQRIRKEGHQVANHTFSHMNGWNNTTSNYLNDIKNAEIFIPSQLFRPPYGRIKPTQIKALQSSYKIIMWSHLSRDYDPSVSEDQCFSYATKNLKAGSIIVFHDSLKAKNRVLPVLERVLNFIQTKNLKAVAI